ncbi:MAG: succinylglutamate desuccinylase/aspartoacylase family protein [Candidatus Gottesmanbacteria bacterium]|nr:succinylglutamate desuccinylase/aspartoacylase family protein [Candidatus Gottesmanbacteria bacterium]
MTLTSVDLGEININVPVYDIAGNRPGKTLLVTGGMDGDEYAGMEACYRVVGRIKSKDIAGRLIVIPIVNTPGFWEEKSFNPIDQKFPKFAGVGKADGTPTQRLVAWLVESYAKHADFWLDLHGGSLTEVMSPFLWAWETGVRTIDTDVRAFIVNNAPRFGIFEWQRFPVGKAAALARMGCRYIVGEAGSSGPRREEDIRHHEAWIEAAMRLEGLIAQKKTSGRTPSILYEKVEFVRCKMPGLWFPADTTIRAVKNGELLGVVRSLNGKKSTAIVAKNVGQLLWIKSGLRALPTDDLVAIAHSPEEGNVYATT